ncbi:septation protein SepH [Microbacterium sp. STN6]|uniref:septation protein SepH n=1 Tax=Microbacterium sp. STN6 TaxID=2995588 RepID=UPI0022609916|nr:septation protein SepH [Microbacterium sp. STN6]MCX7522439.1 septation protein SepH [Microbacterium sp. STN6]
MQELTVIGVENGAILAASDDGERYRIAIDEVLQSRLRQSRSESGTGAPKLSPREVQAYIRSGMSAADVASLTGADLEYIARYEGPILAEREHIVASALSVPVRASADVDPLGEQATFGEVIRERLASLAASGERWASWKEQEGGWIVKLAFTVDEIDHDARWSYDPRGHALTPANSEATTLSQQGELQGGLIPRLRVVTPRPSEPDDSRFDSGAFTFVEGGDDTHRSGPILEKIASSRPGQVASNSIAVTAIKRSTDDGQGENHQTADLLEALRKRRGEREAASYSDADAADDTVDRSQTPRLVDVPLDTFDTHDEVAGGAASGAGSAPGAGPSPAQAQPAQHPASSGRRKGRASMPSWDEIVFGARTDDDPA